LIWSLGIIILSTAVLVSLEVRAVAAKRKVVKQSELWPQFEELYISALQSGISITDAFSYAEEFGLGELQKPISLLVKKIDSGVRLPDAIISFGAELRFGAADLFVEIVRLAHHTGGQNLIQSLQDHVREVRFELEANRSSAARNGAILTVAKLGLLAPWVLLGVLCTNEQNRLVFGTDSGGLLLLGGFSLSLLAFRLVVKAGQQRSLPRIFGQVNAP
jgi:tight adherence protein B